MLGWQVAVDTVLWTTAALCTWKERTARTTLEWSLAISPTGSSTSPCGDEKTSTTQTRTSTRASKDFSWRWHWVTCLLAIRSLLLLLFVGCLLCTHFLIMPVVCLLFSARGFLVCSVVVACLLLLVCQWLFSWYSFLMPVFCFLFAAC